MIRASLRKRGEIMTVDRENGVLVFYTLGTPMDADVRQGICRAAQLLGLPHRVLVRDNKLIVTDGRGRVFKFKKGKVSIYVSDMQQVRQIPSSV